MPFSFCSINAAPHADFRRMCLESLLSRKHVVIRRLVFVFVFFCVTYHASGWGGGGVGKLMRLIGTVVGKIYNHCMSISDIISHVGIYDMI